MKRPKTQTALAFESAGEEKEGSPSNNDDDNDDDDDDDDDDDASSGPTPSKNDALTSSSAVGATRATKRYPWLTDGNGCDGMIVLRKARLIREFPRVEAAACELFSSPELTGGALTTTTSSSSLLPPLWRWRGTPRARGRGGADEKKGLCSSFDVAARAAVRALLERWAAREPRRRNGINGGSDDDDDDDDDDDNDDDDNDDNDDDDNDDNDNEDEEEDGGGSGSGSGGNAEEDDGGGEDVEDAHEDGPCVDTAAASSPKMAEEDRTAPSGRSRWEALRPSGVYGWGGGTREQTSRGGRGDATTRGRRSASRILVDDSALGEVGERNECGSFTDLEGGCQGGGGCSCNRVDHFSVAVRNLVETRVPQSGIDLCIYPSRLVFTSHPEFLKEEQLYREMQLIYSKYICCVRSENIDMFSQSLFAIAEKGFSLADQSESKFESKCDSLAIEEASHPHCLLLDALANLKSLVDAIREIKTLEEYMRKKWRNLLREREKQGFACTLGVELHFVDAQKYSNLSDSGSNGRGKRCQLDSVVDEMRTLLPRLLKLSKNGRKKNRKSTSNLPKASDIDSLCSELEQLGDIHRYAVLKGDFRPSGDSIDKVEQRRRARITSERYFIDVLVNGKTIARTSSKGLAWPSFSVDFERMIRCKVWNCLPSVSLHIYRDQLGGILWRQPLCTVFVQIPMDESCGPSVLWYQFGLRAVQTREGKVPLRGRLLVAGKWETCADCANSMMPLSTTRSPEESERKAVPWKRLMIPERSTGRSARYGRPIENGKVEQTNKHLKQFDLLMKNELSYFHFLGKYSFLDSMLLDQPKRLSLIKIREVEKGLVPSPIPLAEQKIHKDSALLELIDRHRSRKSKQENGKASLGAGADGLSVFAKIVPNSSRQMNQRWALARPRHVTECIRDVSYLRAASRGPGLLDILGLFFPPRKRSLYPKSRNNNVPGRLKAESYKLLVLVSGAKNIPRRRTVTLPFHRFEKATIPAGPAARSTVIEKGRDADDMSLDHSLVSAAVKVTFQGKTSWTRSVSGISPSWKQTASFSLMDDEETICPGKFLHIMDDLEISLFDSYEIDVRNGGGFYDDENTLLPEKKYLGYISIPFNAIYTRKSIQGSFRLRCPDVILGYSDRQTDSTGDEANDDTSAYQKEYALSFSETSGFESHGASGRGSVSNLSLIHRAEPQTFVDLLIMLDPIQCPPESAPRVWMTEEDDMLVKYCDDWMEMFSLRCRARKFPLMIPGPNGLGWIMTRFLKIQPPPKEIDAVHKCAHFVSLIPSLDQPEKAVDAWRTSQEVLEGRAGCRAEHAILLSNYFMYLSNRFPDECGAQVYLALGLGFPEGYTAYVMRKDDGGGIQFWDATAGSVYALEDEGCPLQDIWCLVDSDNIYGNIQIDRSPFQMSFELTDRKCWMTLFSKTLPFEFPLRPIQENLLSYHAPAQQASVELEYELNHHLKSSIRSWRRGLTEFNGEISDQLRLILEVLELAKLDGKVSDQSILDELYDGTSEKNLFGVPMHFHLMQKEAIIDRIEATGVHLSKHPDVEFALAVKVFPYSSSVFSIWVFLAAISPASASSPAGYMQRN